MFHLGNGRTFVFFDIVFRLFKYIYPHITYIRNITDIDDKIIKKLNNNSIELFLNRSIANLDKDLCTLNCLIPSFQPRVSNNIIEIIYVIKKLINNKYAYYKSGNIYLDTNKYNNFICSKKNINTKKYLNLSFYIYKYKENFSDFLLWRSKKEFEQIYFSSPWGNGRPGWHISCTAISKKYLGNIFDIHGGGIDLFAIHHKNEIIQNLLLSNSELCYYWIHSNLVFINYKKMAKTLKNFFTIRELTFYGIDGMTLRYSYLNTHYKNSIIFSNNMLENSKKKLYKFKYCIDNFPIKYKKRSYMPCEFLCHLLDDINTPAILSYLHQLANKSFLGNISSINTLYRCLVFLGFNYYLNFNLIPKKVIFFSNKRCHLRRNKVFPSADSLRRHLNILGYNILDYKYGYNLIIL